MIYLYQVSGLDILEILEWRPRNTYPVRQVLSEGIKLECYARIPFAFGIIVSGT